MKHSERAFITKDLTKASEALHRAYAQAKVIGDHKLCKDLTEQMKGIGGTIAELNGGPVVTLRELI